MRRNKPGLADLKALRNKALASEPPPAPVKPGRVARKRSPFLPPSPARSEESAQHGAAQPPGTSATPPTPAGPVAGSPAASSVGAHQVARSPAAARDRTPAEASALLDDADRRLFRHAVRHVDRLPDPGRVLLPPVAPASPAILEERRRRAAGLQEPAGRQGPSPNVQSEAAHGSSRALSDAYAPADNHHDDSRYLRAGHGTDVLKGLREGKWSIGASLDLHGSTLDEARERFDRFLSSCLAHDVKCVRIVHGKGYGSKGGDAVLKAAVRRWLTQVSEVVAYVECAEPEGGSGAVQVLLK